MVGIVRPFLYIAIRPVVLYQRTGSRNDFNAYTPLTTVAHTLKHTRRATTFIYLLRIIIYVILMGDTR